MISHPNSMKEEEFIKKVLSGERDFSEIKLVGLDLSGHEDYREIQRYLREQDLENSPIIFDGSDLGHLKALGLYLPYVKGHKVDLRCSQLSGANFYGANFERAFISFSDLSNVNLIQANLKYSRLSKTCLIKTNFQRADLSVASMRGACLMGAHLGEANMMKANLTEADIRDVEMLRTAKNIEHMIFGKTKVLLREKEIIEEALSQYNFRVQYTASEIDDLLYERFNKIFKE
jgi:uncharacterized protein YjbI with pentapeptide repeats|tara:strand:+ start:65751 stop:66446 length:696 start_codon:yes stop_codon:yes gene_type:complete